jgi:SAM-dependent methyltransferase
MTAPLLDIGCGEGIFAKVLFADKIDLGIDPQAQEVARAKELGQYSQLIQCFGNEIPASDGSFNTILSNSVLEHIKDLNPVLKEAHRLLAADGNFYITVPTNFFDHYSVIFQLCTLLGLKVWAEKFRLFFNNFWAHYHYFDRSSWIKYLGDMGFDVIESQEYCSRTQGVLNDILAPFSLISFFQKKFFNTWFVFPKLRSLNAFVLSKVFSRFSKVDKSVSNGGIIFFHLKKKMG